MLTLIAKILIQILAVGLAVLIGALDYVWHDMRRRRFKIGRRLLFIFSALFLIGSIVVTIADDVSNNQKEKELKSQLNKVQEQNDGLQQSIKLLGLQNSDLLRKQEEGLVSLLDDQRLLNNKTGTKIESASDLLQSNIKETIAQQKTTLANITGGDSFCYVEPDVADDTVKLVLRSEGQIPLFNITISVLDQDNQKSFTYESSTISTTLDKTLGELSLESLTRKNLSITLQTPHAVFEEIFKLVKVDKDWFIAYVVIKPDAFVRGNFERDQIVGSYEQPKPARRPRKSPISGGLLNGKVLLVSVDYDFPRNKDGYVDWYNDN